VAHVHLFSASAVVALTTCWIIQAGGPSDWTGFGCPLMLQGPALTLPSWCVIHKRFNMSQAGFIERWCLNSVLAEVSSDADESAAVRVNMPPLAAVTVPVALWSSSVLSDFFWEKHPLAGHAALPLLQHAPSLSSCPAVCPLCWLPRRLVYVIRRDVRQCILTRTLD
jgi:hypothetical protein